MRHLVADMMRRYYSPDEPPAGGNAGGTGNGDGTGNKSGQGDGQGNSDPSANGGTNKDGGNAGGASGAGSGGGQGGSNNDGKTFSQADVDRIIQERLTREREKQDREALTKQGEFKTLYETEKAAREKLDADLAGALKYKDTINANIDTEVKDWPKEVKDLDPGKDNVEARSKWLETGRSLVKQLAAGRRAPNGEHGAGGFGAGKGQADPTTQYLDRQYSVPGQTKK